MQCDEDTMKNSKNNKLKEKLWKQEKENKKEEGRGKGKDINHGSQK